MLAQVYSCGLLGVEGIIVTVEVDINNGLPGYAVVGLPDTGIKESKERVYSAIKNSGYSYPMKRITVNLAPADLRKEGPAYDLPVAIGLLAASGQIETSLADTIIVGELSLNGAVKAVSGVLPMVLAARDHGFGQVIIPEANRHEAAVVEGIRIFPVADIRQTVEHLTGEKPIAPYTQSADSFLSNKKYGDSVDFSEIKGQENAKRGLEIAASGAHNVLMSGPPGSGKSMLAKAFPSILPDLTLEEALEITKIYSISGLLDGDIITTRPFRSPHHTVSDVSLIGGGRIPKPGEVSLAHLGVLFLDELPEFRKSTLEVLRQPIEDRRVTISRINATLSYPASFMLIASMNPCPCGYYGDPDHECRCTPGEIRRYHNKLSGPLMDRIDIRMEVPTTHFEDLQAHKKAESSQAIGERVNRARAIQNARFKDEPGLYFNSQLKPKHIETFCRLDRESEAFMKAVYKKLKLSARGYHRILKLARTIADLDGKPAISQAHLAEAVSYRTMG